MDEKALGWGWKMSMSIRCHTYALMVAEETGSIIETQDALGHRHASTTRVYVQRITVKRNKHSEKISRRLLEG